MNDPGYSAAVVVTTYNNPRYLGICLESLLYQTRADFDIWVADDGSTDATREKIRSFTSAFTDELGHCRLKHVRIPDEGYRKAQANNEVLRQMREETRKRGSPYATLIFVDHDTIAHARFVEDHLAMHAGIPRTLFMGRRIDLDPALSDSITQQNVRAFSRGLSPRLAASGLLGRTSNVLRSVRVANPLLQKLLKRDRVPDLLGSNFSVDSTLLTQVNGFNEELQAYWGEDGDLFVRLRNAGARIIGRKGFAIQYHLFHARLTPSPEHERRYAEILQDPNYLRCARGIDPSTG